MLGIIASASSWLGLVVVVSLLLFVWRAAAGATELFRISVEQGRARLVRGRLPRALFDELSDVVRRERLSEGVIRAVVQAGSPRLVLRPDSSSAEQPLRNVLGRFTLTQIRTGQMRAR